MTPQLSAVVSADPVGLSRVTSFGEAVATVEEEGIKPLAARIPGSFPKMDLTTPAGRQQAVNYYKDLFQRFSHDDSFLAGYNIRFDVHQLMESARKLPEFMDNAEAVEALGRFEKRMIGGGGMIDTLQMVRTRLQGQLQERLGSVAGDSRSKN